MWDFFYKHSMQIFGSLVKDVMDIRSLAFACIVCRLTYKYIVVIVGELLARRWDDVGGSILVYIAMTTCSFDEK